MNRELLILRHAKSDWPPDMVNDIDRPLSKRGRRISKRLGKWLRSQALLPDQILCSTAQRTRETALRVCRFAELPESLISWEPRVYEARLETLLDIVGNSPGGINRLLLIGHNPGVEYLVRYLADDSLEVWDTPNLMPAGAVAHMRMPIDWRNLTPACAAVASIGRPRELFDD